MMTSEGFGRTADLPGRPFRPGGLVRVSTDVSVRRGQVAMITAVRGGDYSVVTIHQDGQERVWRPDELVPVAPDTGLQRELEALFQRIGAEL